MSYVPSRKFCCCLPVRIGVIIIGLLGLVFGGLVAIAGIVQATKIQNPNTVQKVAFGVQISVYGLYALMSLLGLIGAFAKKRGLIRAFFGFLTVHVILSIAAGAFSLYSFFQNAPAIVNQCVSDNGSGDFSRKVCEKSISVAKGLVVTLFIVIWLLEIWGCVIVNDYSKQLEEEEVVRRKDAAYLHA